MNIPPQKLQVQSDQKDGVFILRFNGRLDHTQTSMVQKELMILFKNRPQKVLLNLTELEYISSAGLRLLFAIEDQINAFSGTLAMCVKSQPVLDLFNLTGASKRLNLFEDEDEALKSF